MVDEAAVDELEEAKTCPVTVAVHVRPLLGEERSAESLNANTLRCSRAQATQAGQRRPNVILMMADDQDVELGSLQFMPKLNRYLKEEGKVY